MIETRFSKRKKLSNDQLRNNKIKSKHRVANDDRISDLPDAIIHQILSLLPIKFVAQTSVLSKRWRHIWLSFADLDFTTLNTVVKTYTRSRNTQSSSSEQSDFICDILSLRNKQSSDIRKLRLSTHLSLTRLNKLIRLALRRNVQELDIDVATDDHFTLPRSITRTGSLKVLRLKSRHRGFRLPPQSIMASGFRSLDTLVISLVHFREEPTLHNLFTKSSFPFLRKLSLDACIGLTSVEFRSQALQDLSLQHCFQLNQLDIGCPKLENLRITSCFDAYCSKSRARVCAPRLKVLIWECNALIDICDLEELKILNEASIGFFKVLQDIGVERLFGVSSLMSGLCHTRSLTLKSQCIEILSKNNLGVSLQDQFVHLKFLEVYMAFNSINLVGLARLFKISPSLHTLVIRITNDLKNERRQWNRDFWDVPSTDGERHWESQAVGLKSFLNKLTVVNIYGFSEFEDEISLVKFLLKHGTTLQELILCSGHCDGKDSLRRDKIKSQMKGFSWASSNAKVEFQ